MPRTWLFCLCGHPADEHRSTGSCRAADPYGYPCECRTLEVDTPPDGPTETTEPAA
ncbi:hypothetical protein OG689_10965 [Kitasatospora sp. NBC_00240]|uniref:hypothetical protein n=1 Tax=Kitasatospora sp. NBC_00240 TaxID=2903567 RepID=UPI00224E09A8|nr:hypothetical protein [Kitasatospora sp. NBC_00240]MCX5209805.1 hypothetical protein [Kitasatospora sp. NBC_00240]